MDYTKEKKQSIKTIAKEGQTLNLLDKDFKSAIVNKFKELNKTIFKRLKDSMIMMFHQQRISIKRLKNCRRKPNRNCGGEKYSN